MRRCGARSTVAARPSTPADEPAAAEIRGPVTDLLLAIYRRRTVSGLDVTGDATLIDFWLDRVAFG